MEEHPDTHDHRGGRRDVRPPDRQAGGGRVRSGNLEQRTRRATGRRDRAWRRVRAVDRPEGGRIDPVERLLPGVPCRLRLAVRRRPSDRWQARAARRLGVREPLAGAWAGEPQGHTKAPSSRGGTRRGARKAAAGSGSPLANEPMPVPKSPPPRKAVSRTESPSVVPAGRTAPRRRAGADTSCGRRGQRTDAVPRVRGAPSDRHQRERHRRRRTRRTARTSRSGPMACVVTSRCVSCPIRRHPAPAR